MARCTRTAGERGVTDELRRLADSGNITAAEQLAELTGECHRRNEKTPTRARRGSGPCLTVGAEGFEPPTAGV